VLLFKRISSPLRGAISNQNPIASSIWWAKERISELLRCYKFLWGLELTVLKCLSWGYYDICVIHQIKLLSAKLRVGLVREVPQLWWWFHRVRGYPRVLLINWDTHRVILLELCLRVFWVSWLLRNWDMNLLYSICLASQTINPIRIGVLQMMRRKF
jgi:hypothetical protein